jgi:GNAT superfamily N-acetyltransferase
MTDLPAAFTPLLEQWSAELRTRSGLPLHVRPVTSADNELVRRFYASLTADDLRFRFLSPISRPSSSLLEALVAVDHVQTEDFLAFTPVNGEMELIATALLAADPSLDRAEVAIAVHPEYKNKGIGWTLLDFLSRDAEARDIGTLESVECRDNSAAINLEKEMGFTAEPYPGDASLTLLRKRLAART